MCLRYGNQVIARNRAGVDAETADSAGASGRRRGKITLVCPVAVVCVSGMSLCPGDAGSRSAAARRGCVAFPGVFFWILNRVPNLSGRKTSRRMRRISARLLDAGGPFSERGGRVQRPADAAGNGAGHCPGDRPVRDVRRRGGNGNRQDIRLSGSGADVGRQGHYLDRNAQFAATSFFSGDIPTVRKALASPVTVALLKGRSNYVCRLHLARAAEYGRLADQAAGTRYLREIVRSADMTDTGDKSDLPTVPETASVWNLVTSTKENCPGTECPHYQDAGFR